MNVGSSEGGQQGMEQESGQRAAHVGSLSRAGGRAGQGNKQQGRPGTSEE